MRSRWRTLATATALVALLVADPRCLVRADDDSVDNEHSYVPADGDDDNTPSHVRADSNDDSRDSLADLIEDLLEDRTADSQSKHSYSFESSPTPTSTPTPTLRTPSRVVVVTPKSTTTTPTPTPKPTPTLSPPQAPLISAQAMSVETAAPMDSAATPTIAPEMPVPDQASHAAPSSGSASTSTGANGSDGSCPLYNEITSECGGVCGNNVLCIKYREGGECVDTTDSTCLHPPGDLCAYECLDGTSRDFDQWFISPYAVPAWDPALHSNKQIEAMRMLAVPRNITQLSIQFLFNELNGSDVKGKVASVAFPDKRLVSADSALSSIALVNVDHRQIPTDAYAANLQFLVLQNTLLEELPAPVLELQQLNFLNLMTNSISSLPETLAQLPLTALYMDENEFTQFPAFLAHMSSLKVASFVANKITKFTTVARTSAMTELGLDYNQLTDFAGVIPSLKLLYLRGNQLTSFPSAMPSLANLEVLDLTENALSSQSIAQAGATLTHPYLNELMLGSNGLHSVPDLGDVFPNLKTLWVRNNSIEKVEGDFGGKLETLRAFSNKIKTFTASFPRLTTLDLSDNKLESLPDVASISPVLQHLNVSSNQFEKLETDKPLTTLVVFNASHNSIASFSLQMPILRTLDLSHNKLKTIPSSLWTYNVLDELHLEGNGDLKSVQFTQDQHAFLKRLSVFTMDTTAMRSDCPEGWKAEVKAIAICVVDGSDESVTLKSGASGSSTWTWVSILMGLVAAVGLAAFIFVVHRRRSRYDGHYDDGKYTSGLKPEDRTAGLTQSLGFGTAVRTNPHAGIWDDEELQERRVDYDSIKFESKLAAGAYGEVWIGTYRMECVAVKKLSDAGMRNKNALNYFVGEIKLLAQLDHPRIIRFYGVAWTCLTDLCAVIEYMPGGDLHSMLRSNVLPTGRWNAGKLQIALDTVEALTYVHTLDDVLIHRDLKSRNVLLDDDWRAKVTDFGISRYQRDTDATMTSGVGTGRWMAPEVIMGRSDYTEKVDIYSFGVILSELDTHEMPYAVVQSGDEQLPLSEMGILQQVATGELRPSFLPTCPPSIVEIANKCLAFHPEDRPGALEVAYWLRQLIPLFPRDEAPRPSSIFARGTFTATASRRKSAVTTTYGRSGSEIMPSSSGDSGEFSL